ncbi:MAG TPA: bifunctional class I SAM-dependent methyltransferase/glycosyltransferase family 2 protein [Stellaceae bacterium]|nr:bifunctional class I SAM-dependent methyltransferase/glycosyltransferase family 2 protein [Stellaceae bacterium]
MPEATIETVAERPLSPRKAALRDLADRWAPRRNRFIERNRAFHEDEFRYLRFLVPEGLDVLEVGCSTGRLLAELRPARGVGVDLSPGVVEIARADHPQLRFAVGDIEDPAVIASLGGPFDVIVMAGTIGLLEDCQATLASLRRLCHGGTRLVIAYHNYLWEPVLRLAEALRLRLPEPNTNWLQPPDMMNLLSLADFEPVRQEWRQLIPARLFGLGSLINRFIGTLPGIRRLCLRNYLVARPMGLQPEKPASATVVVPCRNERGTIEALVRRIPAFAPAVEILFVEGNSADGTYEEIERIIPLYPARDIKVLRQNGKGKGDAVRQGLAQARGDVVMILDSDMTVPPEELPKFYDAIARDKGEFINGSRLVYPMERDAMQFLNRVANHVFSLLFSWLINQRFTDTLCGTKALRRSHYQRIAASRAYFGDFDPFGDFDLLFGAAKLNLKIIEVPVRYLARVYGSTQISRFRHGWLLLRMVSFAYLKLKAMP